MTSAKPLTCWRKVRSLPVANDHNNSTRMRGMMPIGFIGGATRVGVLKVLSSQRSNAVMATAGT